MSIIESIRGWKTIIGLCGVIAALLFQDGLLGDGGVVSQAMQYFMYVFGGGLCICGIVGKIQREAAEKARGAMNNKGGGLSDIMPIAGIMTAAICTLIDAGKSNGSREPSRCVTKVNAPTKEEIDILAGLFKDVYDDLVNDFKAQPENQKKGGVENANEDVAACLSPADASAKKREPNMVDEAMNTCCSSEPKEDKNG